jgi:hypothetical protein
MYSVGYWSIFAKSDIATDVIVSLYYFLSSVHLRHILFMMLYYDLSLRPIMLVPYHKLS